VVEPLLEVNNVDAARCGHERTDRQREQSYIDQEKRIEGICKRRFFSLAPQGEHTCVVCLGTACYVKGAATLLAAVEHTAGVKAGATTSDKRLSLLTARCLGACGIAPAVVFDGTVAGHQTTAELLERVKGWFENGSG
jgi:NADH:ubiquinone oxidoreductase subunit E